MIAYVDASVVLRVVLRQPGRLEEWDEVREGIASAIVEVECMRTLDRLRVARRLDEHDVAVRREAVYRLLDELSLVAPGRAVLSRAAHPMPAPLGTLDAIHLATALVWRDTTGSDLVMATHDEALALAARASGLTVVGTARNA